MFWLLACNGGSESKSVETAEDTAVVDEINLFFSIAVLADPHISGNAEHSARLQEAIAWINEHRENPYEWSWFLYWVMSVGSGFERIQRTAGTVRGSIHSDHWRQ